MTRSPPIPSDTPPLPVGRPPAAAPTLESLMARAQKGDQEAYRQVLLASQAMLRVHARRSALRFGWMDPALAEDAVQETLIALHAKRHTYDPAQAFAPWLLAIARYKMIDRWRREAGSRRGVPWDEDDPKLAAGLFAEEGARLDIEAALARLPEPARQAVTRVKLEGWSHAEAAAALGLSESHVKVMVHRALRKLRHALGRPG